MEHSWDKDTLCLVINRKDLPVDAGIVDMVWDMAMESDANGDAVAKYIVLTISILFKGVLQFLE